MRELASFKAARHLFEEYAAVEPRLTELWLSCCGAGPPPHDSDDAFDGDAYDIDSTATSAANNRGWCAEDYFAQEIKPRLLLLIGWYRSEDPEVLRSSKAYNDVYVALFDYALNRTCVCCCKTVQSRPDVRGGSAVTVPDAEEQATLVKTSVILDAALRATLEAVVTRWNR